MSDQGFVVASRDQDARPQPGTTDTAKPSGEATLADAERAHELAEKNLRALRSEITRRKIEAEKAVAEEFEDRLRSLSAAVRVADIAVREAKDREIGPHEWEGCAVQRVYRTGPSWNQKEVVERGVVETVRQTSEFPANTSRYSRPALGTVIVRAIKKDGSPGLKFESFASHRAWKLEPSPQPKDNPQALGEVG